MLSTTQARRRLQTTQIEPRIESGVSSPKRARVAAVTDSPESTPTKGPLKQSAGENSPSILAVSFYGLKKDKAVKENVPLADGRSKSGSVKSSNASEPPAKFVTQNKSVCQRSDLDKLMQEKIAHSPVKQAFLQRCSLAEFRKVYRDEFKELEEEMKRTDVRVTRKSSQILNKKTEDSSEDSSDEEDTREQDLNFQTRTKPPSKTVVSSCDSQPLNGISIPSPRRNQQRKAIKDKSNEVMEKICIPGDNSNQVRNGTFNSSVVNSETVTHAADDLQSTPKLSTPPSKERKFFKTRSPLESAKNGVAVLTKGFGLKYMSSTSKAVSSKRNSPGQKRQCGSHSPRTVSKSLVHNVSASRKSNRKQNRNSVESVSQVSGFSFVPGFLSPEKVAPEKSADDEQEEDDSESFSLDRSSCSTYSSASQNHTIAEASDSQSVDESVSVHLCENSSCPVGERETDLSVRNNSSGSHVDQNDTSHTKGDQTPKPSHKLFPIFERRNDEPALSNKKRSSPLQLNNTSSVSMLTRQSPKMPKDSSNSQMIIDAGQKKFGVTQCPVCGMVYCHADQVDEAAHAKFHRQHQEVLKFTGWKKERVVQEYPEDLGRVILVMPDDPKYAKKKVEEVNQLMGRELGFHDASSVPIHPYHKVFLYVEDKQITGCCVAEPVHEGYRIIPGDLDKSEESGKRPWCCSPDPEPVCVGISRLWVSATRRKSGVATKLVDCVRQWFNYGSLIPKNKIAFSDPTPDGRRFAQKYTGTPTFLVYKYNYG
ncbi:hypothetical protein BsWGS_02654 [Bradybaena similaris]